MDYFLYHNFDLYNYYYFSRCHKVCNVSVNTIDSYQGQEKDIIFISSARTDGIGFTGQPQRLNVALTRAKKCLMICGNYISIGKSYVWQKIIQNARDRKLYYNHDSRYDSVNKLLDKLKIIKK